VWTRKGRDRWRVPVAGLPTSRGEHREPNLPQRHRHSRRDRSVGGLAAAQDYPWQPNRPITIIVPWAAGGSTDQVTRVIASELEGALGVAVVVVNQPGASGSIGTANALAAEKDGYTWAAGAIRDVGTYVVLGMLDTSVDQWHPYFAVSNTSIVVVNPNTPYQTFDLCWPPSRPTRAASRSPPPACRPRATR
jgi:hypothetical protein